MSQIKEIPIICINLARAKDRREYIEQEWIGNRGCPVHFIEAFDRRSIDEGNLPSAYNKDTAMKYLKRYLSNGEIACNVSQYSAVKYAKDNGWEQVIIIEDDAEPLFNSYEQLNQVIANMHHEFPESTVALLHNAFSSKAYKLGEVKEYFSKVTKASYGCTGYYLHNKAYDKLNSFFSSFQRPVDWYWDDFASLNQLVKPTNSLINHIGKTTYVGNDFRGKISHRQYID